MATGLTVAALQQLVDIEPPNYINRSGGTRIIRSVFDRCKAARLTDAQAPTDVSALEAVFDVALHNGLGCLILDYVHEVCMSRTLVSSDPIDAAMLDGSTVQRWCQSALHRSKAKVLEQLNNVSLERLHGSAVLQQESGCINALLLVVKALASEDSNRSEFC